MDTVVKKLVANINYGLIEKGGATDQESLLFKNLNEAAHYQTEYGGKIHRLTEMEGKEEYENYSPSNETEKSSYHMLNLKDKAQLMNGFKYTKELLLQHHNFRMNTDLYKLLVNGVNVYSVKTDAFVIDEYDLEKAKELLDSIIVLVVGEYLKEVKISNYLLMSISLLNMIW